MVYSGSGNVIGALNKDVDDFFNNVTFELNNH